MWQNIRKYTNTLVIVIEAVIYFEAMLISWFYLLEFHDFLQSQ